MSIYLGHKLLKYLTKHYSGYFSSLQNETEILPLSWSQTCQSLPMVLILQLAPYPVDHGTCQPPQSCEPIPHYKFFLYIHILLVLLLWRMLTETPTKLGLFMQGFYAPSSEFLHNFTKKGLWDCPSLHAQDSFIIPVRKGGPSFPL